MTTRWTATAVIALALIASVAFAQMRAPATQGREAASEASSHADAAPAMAQAQARLHTDADARTCLEFLTNTGVIRCAERYRGHSIREGAARH